MGKIEKDLPLPLPRRLFFGSRSISRAAKNENPVFLGLSTETLATQATIGTTCHTPRAGLAG